MANVTRNRENLQKQYPEIFNTLFKLEKYTQRDLRRRFDEAEGHPQTQIGIIEEARNEFDFTELVDSMANDFCVNHADLWTAHLQATYRDIVPDEADRFYEWREEVATITAYEEERHYIQPERW